MSQSIHDPRTREVPEDIRAMVADCVSRRGPTGASRALGVSRSVVLTVCAGEGVLPGTLALLREALIRREAA